MPEIDWIWHAEIEPFPSAVLAARFPGSVNLGDVLAPDFMERAKELGPLDVLAGGPPCQGFSIAGLRGGMSHETYAWAKDVRALATAADPIGPDNGYRLCEIFLDADRVIFAWGPSSKLPARLRDQWREVDRIARAMHCEPLSIGVTANDGHPKHPLMLPYDAPLIPWRLA